MSSSGLPVLRLAAALLKHADVAHHHAAVGGLAHVVNGEQADEFFAPCKAEPASGEALPFQCQQPGKVLGYADFR